MADRTTRSEVRAYIERIGNLASGRQSVVMPILIILSLGSLSRWMSEGSQVLAVASRGIVIAGFFAWVFFTICALCLNLGLKRPSFARGSLFALVYGLTETVRAMTLAAYLSNNGVARNVAWSAEATSAFLTGLALFSVASLFVGDSRQYRTELAELLQQRERLERALGEVQLSIRSRRDDLLHSVRDVIASALTAVLERSRTRDRIDEGLVAELNRISAEVVRPLSHGLYGQTNLEDLLSKGVERPKVRLTRVIMLSSVTRPFRPWALSAVLLLLASPVAIFSPQPLLGAAALLGMVCWTVVFLEIARRFVAPLLSRIRFAARVATVFTVYIAYIEVVTLPLNALSESFNFEAGLLQSLYILSIGLPLLTVLALTPGIREARIELIDELEATNQNLTWLRARLGAELWADRKAIARSLHQDVQSVLVAASFRLQRALDTGDDVQIAVAEVEQIIEMAAGFVVAPPVTPTMSFAIDALRERWAGIVTVDFEADTPAIQSLSYDRVARQVLQEALAEFTLNSVKHGLATHVEVRAHMVGARLMAVEMWNDGAPIPDDAAFDGLGSRLVEKMGVSGGYANEDGRVVFRATAPIVAEGDDWSV